MMKRTCIRICKTEKQNESLSQKTYKFQFTILSLFPCVPFAFKLVSTPVVKMSTNKIKPKTIFKQAIVIF